MNSKKFLFSFLFVGIIAIQNTFCQTTTSLFAPTCSFFSEDAVGRVSSDGEHIISHHKHQNTNEFFWTDIITNNCKKFTLQNGINVSDFELISDTVYFCGFDNSYGIVGYYTESVFTTGVGNVYYAKIPEIRYLTKMEVYANQNNNHVVAAIGYEKTGNNQNNTGVFVFEFLGSNISYNWRTTIGDNSTHQFVDVALTPKNIVTVGISNFLGNQFMVTITDKANTNVLYPYFFTETAGNLNSINYSIEYLQDEEVAISTLVSDMSIPTLFVSPVHVFDANTASFVNSQVIPLLQKTAPYNEMKYFPNHKKLILLQTNEYPTLSDHNSVFYYLSPYNTATYYALATFDNDSYYYSLDRFSKNKYLATGELKSLSHSFLMHDIMSSPIFQCLKSNYHKIDIINPPSLIYNSHNNYNIGNSVLDSFHTNIIVDSVTIKCVQQ